MLGCLKDFMHNGCITGVFQSGVDIVFNEILNLFKLLINNNPNFNKKIRPIKSVKLVIIHYTGMQSEIESLKRLKSINSKVSCHYLINRKGIITQMVKDDKVAWHAGKSSWKNYKSLNHNSIGVEISNPGHQFGYKKFSKKQISSAPPSL